MKGRVAAALIAVGVAGPGGAVPPADRGRTCSFGVGNALAFGVYDPFATAPLDSTTTLTFRCPPGQAPQISLDPGSSASFAARELRSGSERLLYNLYLDAARTTVWGDGTGGSSVGPGAVSRGALGTTTAYVFGRVTAAQDVAPGTYSDTITITFQL
jgi:spore coat protein U-like protein